MTTYAVFERLFWLIESKEFYLKNYLEKFSVSRRTAFRDFKYLRETQGYEIELYEGKYYLHKRECVI